MAAILAECMRSYDAGKRRVLAGTKATVVGATSHPVPSVRLEVADEDWLDVPVGDLSRYWKTHTSGLTAPILPPGPRLRPGASGSQW